MDKKDIETRKICYIDNKEDTIDQIEREIIFINELKKGELAPERLYKFYSDKEDTKEDENGDIKKVNYSREALKNNTVFMQSPKEYNDPYDTHFKIDEKLFIKERIKYCLSLKNITYSKDEDVEILLEKLVKLLIKEYEKVEFNFNTQFRILTDIELYHCFMKEVKETLSPKDIQLIKRKEISSDIILERVVDEYWDITRGKELMERESFKNLLFTYLHDDKNNNFYKIIIKNALVKEMEALYAYKVACFSSKFDSILMWSHYADNHRGFCIEYDLSDEEIHREYFKQSKYILPVIYSNFISDSTKEFLRILDGLYDFKAKKDAKSLESLDLLEQSNLLELFFKKGVLRKSEDWKYENEWRMIQNIYQLEDNPIKFKFPIKKVYLGNKMKAEDRKEIIEICKTKNIKFHVMKLKSDKYKMAACEKTCGSCNNCNNI